MQRLDKLRPTMDTGTEADVALDNNGSVQSQSQYSPPNQIPKAVQVPQNLGPSKLKMPGGSEGSELRTADALSPPSSAETKIQKRENQSKLPQLFMSHGTHDPLVLHSWAKSTFSKLRVSCLHCNFTLAIGLTECALARELNEAFKRKGYRESYDMVLHCPFCMLH